MSAGRRRTAALFAVAIGLFGAGGAGAAETTVLDTYGFWRMHATLRPPVIRESDRRTVPVLTGFAWVDESTDDPPADWAAPDFDDGGWMRAPARHSPRTPCLARLCLRGYFGVDDPAAAGELRLSLQYQGGAIVYLNGKEVTRRNVAAADSAEPYPPDAFVDAGGALLAGWDQPPDRQGEDHRRRLALRTRAIENIVLPRELLRRGSNVLAVELVRAPYPPAVDPQRLRGGRDSRAPRRWNELFPLAGFAPHFNTCEFTGLRLTTSGPAGLQPNAVRQPGVRAWNSDLLQSDTDLDFGGQSGEPLRPVRIAAARNGAFSGKFVLGSTESLGGIRVAPGDLAAGAAVLPAASVQVRYALPWGSEYGLFGMAHLEYDKGPDNSKLYAYPRRPTILGALHNAPPAEPLPPVRPAEGRGFVADPRLPPPPEPVAGAVLPVWLTVRVPKTAAAGRYRGTVTVTVAGAGPLTVPVEVEVADWTLPDPEEFGAWVDAVQSPDTLSVEYGAPLWSDRHWSLVANSLDLLRGIGNRVVYLPLIARTNLGNEESLVRWIEREGGRMEFDFSVFDRYLDLWQQRIGRPGAVVLWAWEIYFAENKQLKPGFDERELSRAALEAKAAARGRGPAVTFVDPATGGTEARFLTPLLEGQHAAAWRELLRQTMARLERRGLADRAMLGTMSDAWPSKAETAFFAEAAGRPLPWFSDSHMGVAGLAEDMKTLAAGRGSPSMREAAYPTVTAPLDEIAVLQLARYSARVWNCTLPNLSETGESQRGWSRSDLYVQHDRHANQHPQTRWRTIVEMNLLGGQRGIGRLGGDWWNCVRDRRGNRAGLVRDRYPESGWRNLDLNIQLLTPGPDGAIATHRFESLREGLQASEARVFIERALSDPRAKPRLGAALAGRAQRLLHRRGLLLTKANSMLQFVGADSYLLNNGRGWFQWPNLAGHAWYAGAGATAMDAELYRTAGEVARALR